MAREHYPDAYREQIVALAREGRTLSSLAREFEPSIQTIRSWVRAADGPGQSEDRAWAKKYRQLVRVNVLLREERDILEKATAWFAREVKPMVPRAIGS